MIAAMPAAGEVSFSARHLDIVTKNGKLRGQSAVDEAPNPGVICYSDLSDVERASGWQPERLLPTPGASPRGPRGPVRQTLTSPASVHLRLDTKPCGHRASACTLWAWSPP